MAGGAAQRSGESGKASRSREEIERVFDTNKGRIFTLYNRALRENPALQGKVVLKLTIAPDGRVQSCEVVSSELNDPELEKGLVQRVLQFQFEPKDVETDHDDQADRLLPGLTGCQLPAAPRYSGRARDSPRLIGYACDPGTEGGTHDAE